MPVLDHSDFYVWYTMPIADKIVGKLPVPIDDMTLLQIVEDCANGLMVAHEKGCIHRDLTPNNILFISVGSDARWVISDWGLVRRRRQTTVVRTAYGQLLGTEGFAAPEMYTDPHNADERADVYSLGRVVAWSITGEWPTPNIPLLPKGKWSDFVRITTELDLARRARDMTSVLELAGRTKGEKKSLLNDSVVREAVRGWLMRSFSSCTVLEEHGVHLTPRGVRMTSDFVVAGRDGYFVPVVVRFLRDSRAQLLHGQIGHDAQTGAMAVAQGKISDFMFVIVCDEKGKAANLASDFEASMKIGSITYVFGYLEAGYEFKEIRRFRP